MITAEHVADYLLSLSKPEVGDIISHLKLQKLVYYCQGFHLAAFNEPLFNEKIYAWAHGPVVRSLWHKYKDKGSSSLEVPPRSCKSYFSKKQQKLMQEVYDFFGQYSAWKLRNMTHSEPPWKKTSKDEVITHVHLKKYFKTLLADA